MMKADGRIGPTLENVKIYATGIGANLIKYFI